VLFAGVLLSVIITYNVNKQLKTVIIYERESIVNKIRGEYLEFETHINYLKGYFSLLYKDRIAEMSEYLNKKWASPEDIPDTVLSNLLQQNNISEISIIDKEGNIIKTTDENIVNTHNRESISFRKDNYKILFTNLNTSKIGICSYYIQDKSNYIIKTVHYIDNKSCNISNSNMLNDMLYSHIKDISTSNQIVQNMDLFNMEDSANVSLLNNGEPLRLSDSEKEKLIKEGIFRIKTKTGEKLYSLIDIKTNIEELPNKLILYVNFNYSNRYYFARHILIYIVVIILLLLLIISVISPVFIDRILFKKIDIINYNLNALRFARYDNLKSFEGNDELSSILENIEHVRDSVLEREEQLMESKELVESANKLKSAFLANMSHEIRTPLNAVVGFAQLLRDVNPSPEDTVKYVGLINSNSNKLLQIINDIIDLSQIESGQIKIINKTVCLNELFMDIYASSQSKLYGENLVYEDKKINIILDIKPSVKNLCIVSDSYRLKQIMEQLIDNAIKFSCNGDIKIGYNLTSNFVELFVDDKGIGIAEDNIKKIFDRFVQIEDYMTREYGGTGLGLAICKELTRMMGGSIKVKSSLNKGSLFTIKIPYVEPKC
jgi:signal transduction histidine kinase